MVLRLAIKNKRIHRINENLLISAGVSIGVQNV